MSRFASISRNILTLSIGVLIQKILGGILFIALARYVGEADIGKYGVANSFSALFILFTDMGLETVSIRAIAQNPDLASKYLGHTAIIRAAMAVLAFLMMGVGILWADFPGDKTTILWLVAASVFVGNLAGGFRWLFRACNKFKYESALIGGESLMMFSGGLLILGMGYGIVAFTGVRLLFAVLTSAVAVWLAVGTVRPAFTWEPNFARTLVLTGLPIMILSVCDQVMFNLDNILLNFISGDIESGRFTTAYRLITMLLIIPGLFQVAAFPEMITAADKPVEEFVRVAGRSLRYMLIIGLGVTVLVTACAPSIIRGLYSDQFIAAAPMLQALIWMFLFHSLSVVGINIAYACHQETAVLKINAIGLVFNLVLNLLMIPSLGGVGAAIAAVLSRGLICFMILLRLRRHLPNLSINQVGLRPLLAGGLFMLVMGIVAPLPVWAGAAIGVTLYSLMLLALRAITSQDLDLVFRLVQNRTKTS